METNNPKKTPEISDTYRQGSTFCLELTETDSPVPFKIIKREQEESDQFPVDPLLNVKDEHCSSNEDNTEASELSTKTQLKFRVKTLSCDVHHQFKKRYGLEYVISSDESSSEGDLQLHNISGTGSSSEDVSDFNDTVEGTANAGTNEPEDTVSPDRPPTDQWTSKKTTIKKLEFIKKQELRIPPPQTPFEAFRWFLNDEILSKIVLETNKNRARRRCKEKVGAKSRYKSWTDVTKDDIINCIGLLLHAGTFRTNGIEDYWRMDYLFNWSCFREHMKRVRFLVILQFISFGSLKGTREDIGLIRPIVENFNTKMKEMYYPGKELFVANPMVLQRGQLVRQELGKLNPSTDVIGLYMLAEPNGTVIKYQVCSGNVNKQLSRLTTGKIAIELLEGYLGNGHALYMNRSYSSWILAKKLLHMQTHCTGILSKRSPDNLFVDTDGNLAQQSNRSLFLDGVHIGEWKDDTSVLYISTEFDDQLEQVVEHENQRLKPKAVMNFCKYMAETDLQDRLMSHYPLRRKSLSWIKKLFIHSIQIYLNNAYHLYKNYSDKNISFYSFRMEVIKAMLRECTNVTPRSIGGVLAEPHHLTRVTPKKLCYKLSRGSDVVKEVCEVGRKLCQVCCQRQLLTRTMYECVSCFGSPGYCVSCFSEIHT